MFDLRVFVDPRWTRVVHTVVLVEINDVKMG